MTIIEKREPVARKSSKPSTPPVQYGPQKKKHPYYDYSGVLSHNGTYNFIVGGRGLGKTYGAKKLAINNYLRRGKMFIYLRRYKEELIARETFFADIGHEFPEWDFRAQGNNFQIAPISTRDAKPRQWDTIGYAVALSTAQKQKSIAFPLVELIIFDEFLIEKGMIHYLPNEADVFNNFYSTVDRWQDKTRVLFLANAVEIRNPYFLRYLIRPTSGEELLKYNNGFIVVHLPNSKDFQSSVMGTRFGQFIQGTDYESYAVGNEFVDNRTDLVRPKNPRARALCNVETRLGWLSVWHDAYDSLYYCASRRITDIPSFTMVPSHVSRETPLVFNTDGVIESLCRAYRTGRVEFDHASTNGVFLDVFDGKR